METNYALLNRVFSRNTINSFLQNSADDTFSAAIERYVEYPEGKSNSAIISEIYRKLHANYRNEYFYKNTLLNKLLLGVHSSTTTTALSEVPVHRSKADFILINGKAVVYEIKTDLDNLDRLENQLMDYYKAFCNVCVVTSESSFVSVDKKLRDTNVGIYILTNRNTISLRKPATYDSSYLDQDVIFKVMRKKEYENILINYYNHLPNVSQFVYYNECRRMFNNIEVSIAYDLFVKELKKRNRVDAKLLSTVPTELKSIVYFSEFRTNDYERLSTFLSNQFGG